MGFTHLRLSDIPDRAAGHGIDSLEARPARAELGAERIGLTRYNVRPNRRVGFGHRHDAVEEIYLVTAGSGRFRLDDTIVEVAPGEVVYCSPEVMREWEAGTDGLELVAFGSHAEGDGSMEPGWWTD